jgi:hypothetical protein
MECYLALFKIAGVFSELASVRVCIILYSIACYAYKQLKMFMVESRFLIFFIAVPNPPSPENFWGCALVVLWMHPSYPHCSPVVKTSAT